MLETRDMSSWARLIQETCQQALFAPYFCHLLQSTDTPFDSSGCGRQHVISIDDMLSRAQQHSVVREECPGGPDSRDFVKRRHLTLLLSCQPKKIPLESCAYRL